MGAPSQEWLDRQRMVKAADLELLAMERGLKAADLADEAVREVLRLALAKKRGKRPSQVRVSIDTWRVVWKLLHEQETRGQRPDPFAGLPGDGR